MARLLEAWKAQDRNTNKGTIERKEERPSMVDVHLDFIHWEAQKTSFIVRICADQILGNRKVPF